MNEASPRDRKPLVEIIDYGIGNLRSVANAIELVGAASRLVAKADEVAWCDAIVLPGVGAFQPAMRALHASGMIPPLTDYVQSKRPLLGICLGMQLLCRRSLENGDHAGLGWIAADVLPIPPDAGLKVPHMGWNTLEIGRQHSLVADLPANSDAYFLHSFFVACDDDRDVVATCYYGAKLPAIIASGTIYGMQFHPEKSQDIGLFLLKNFIASAAANAGA